MLTRRLNSLPVYKQHIFSLLFSLSCIAAAIIISSACYRIIRENPMIVSLIFTFFLILASCNSVGCFYGIMYSLLSVIWFHFIHDHAIMNLTPTLFDIFITFMCMSAIAVLVNNLTSHLLRQCDLIAESERRLTDAEKEKMRADLFRAISHDLRTPLTGILGNSTAFLENQECLGEEEKRIIVTNIYEDSNWLINMAENLLTMTRIKDDNLSISTRDESVEEVVAEALQKVKKRHPECMIHTQVPGKFLMLPMDAVLIEQVAINLLENALFQSKSTAPVDFIVEDADSEVIFTVRDYGIGIPNDKLNCLFDGIYYANIGAADANKGMGIGLAICKTIITAHHGRLTGTNHAQGAEFTFTLPKTKDKLFAL